MHSVKPGLNCTPDDAALRYRCADLISANRELENQLQELQWLLQISDCLSNNLDKSETIDSIKKFFLTNFDLDEFSLILKTQQGGKLRIFAASGTALKVGKQFALNHSDPLFNHLIHNNQPLYLRDLLIADQSPRFSQLSSGALLCLPLCPLQDQVIGFISFGKAMRESFSQEEIERFQLLSNHVAVVLHKATIYQNTKELAFTDELTGIFNRRYFNQRYQREIGRARRYQRFLSVLMIDIDHFKKFNDTLGHLQGDRVLKEMAGLFEENVRKADILCRYGGEEFVVILPEIHLEQAVTVAEKLRKQVANRDFIGEQHLPGVKVTISIGAAAFPENGGSADEVLQIADLALYAAKQQGRDRVIAAKNPAQDRRKKK